MEKKKERSKMIRNLLFIILLFGVLVLSACSSKLNEADDLLMSKSEVSDVYYFTGFKTCLSNEAKLTREIISENARYIEGRKIFELDNLKVNFYGDEQIESVVVADKGIYESQNKKVTLNGNVQYKDITDKSLKTDSMIYDGNTDLIYSKSHFVFEVTQEDGSILRNEGVGFEADSNLRNIKTIKGKMEFIPGKKKGKSR